MASDTPAKTASPPQVAIITEPTFIGFLWSGVAVSLCFLLFRLYVKMKSFGRLYSDDYVIIAAWGMLLATSILWQTVVPNQYEQYAVASGRTAITPDFVADQTHLMHTLAPLLVLFYTCLWAVKLSLLLFFRRLGSNVTGQEIWWWSILVVTVLTGAACIGNVHWSCFLTSYLYIEANCANDINLASIHFNNRTFIANAVADVVTDCLILSLPIMIVWRARLPMRKKVILVAVFSLTVIVMAVSIIRVTVVYSPKKDPNVGWLYFWSNVESTTSIIVACLASFRQLFIANRHAGSPGGDTSRRGLLSRLWIFSRFDKVSKTYSNHHAKWPFSPEMEHQSSSKPNNRAHFVPLDGVHVRHNMHVHNESEPEG